MNSILIKHSTLILGSRFNFQGNDLSTVNNPGLCLEGMISSLYFISLGYLKV